MADWVVFFQEEQLNDVEQICPSFGAFAAVAGNGHVITWGDYDFGADSWLPGGVKTWRNETTHISIENHPGGDVSRVLIFLFFFEGGVRVLGVDFGWFVWNSLVVGRFSSFVCNRNEYLQILQ